ncbi:Intradiol ring-cleavage dioxygenase [Crepidotus variabilis]|uniref:Intradiol ring-cleavage dioxygenase n=1 Tax=Crepidotus variabilis TaxID=179855 RepID=A0A9P6JNU6_9AGAR|nr:Intradiol ring-cleavage dioxygenase [Crepidotus variabilis]
MLTMQGILNVVVLTLAVSEVASAHKKIKTEQEKEVQRVLQRAAYHCAPAVESFTRARKQAFAKRHHLTPGTGGVDDFPSIPSPADGFVDQQQLFSADSYADLDGEKISSTPSPTEDGEADDDTHMRCTPISDTYIQNNTCVLSPEVTEGPYYHIAGHPIRQNIAEFEDGLPLYLDIGVIDVETCRPMPNVLVDIWQANSTGYYAGHPYPRPGLEDEKPATEGPRKGLRAGFPRTIQEETFLRGAYPTDKNGVAQFSTIYPGYYTGRATHIHTKVFTSWAPINENNTFTADRLAHVGQFFFDEDLNTVVDKMYPYMLNPIRHTIGRTRNLQDSLNIFNESRGIESRYNPVFKVHMLGGVISQGVVGYITMGVNGSASYDNWWKGGNPS